MMEHLNHKRTLVLLHRNVGNQNCRVQNTGYTSAGVRRYGKIIRLKRSRRLLLSGSVSCKPPVTKKGKYNVQNCLQKKKKKSVWCGVFTTWKTWVFVSVWLTVNTTYRLRGNEVAVADYFILPKDGTHYNYNGSNPLTRLLFRTSVLVPMTFFR